MVSKRIEFKDEKESEWKKFVAECGLRDIIVGEAILDLIEKHSKEYFRDKK